MSWFDLACVLMRFYALTLADVRRMTRAQAVRAIDNIDRTERFLRVDMDKV
jgi:hypothetical protein